MVYPRAVRPHGCEADSLRATLPSCNSSGTPRKPRQIWQSMGYPLKRQLRHSEIRFQQLLLILTIPLVKIALSLLVFHRRAGCLLSPIRTVGRLSD